MLAEATSPGGLADRLINVKWSVGHEMGSQANRIGTQNFTGLPTGFVDSTPLAMGRTRAATMPAAIIPPVLEARPTSTAILMRASSISMD